MRRQFGDALLHLVEGELIEPDELDPVHEGLELAKQLLFPEFLHRRGADDHGHVGRLRQHIEDVLDEPVHVEAARNDGVVICQHVSLQGSIVHRRIQRRNVREEMLPLALREIRCVAADRHYQIRLSTHQKCLQIVDKGRVFQRCPGSGGHEGNLDQVHRLPEFPGQFIPEDQ